MAAVRKGNEYQIVRDAERLVFRRPIGPRLLCGMGAVMFLGVTLFFVVVIPFVAFGPHSYPPGAFIMLGMALFMAVFGLGFLYLTGPCELSFDLRQRTYRFLRGVPLLPRVTEGKIEEFDYLYTRGIYYYAYAMTDARIYLVWKTPAKILGFLPQPEVLIGMLSSMDQAYQQACEYARILGLRVEEKRLKRAGATTSAPAPPRDPQAGVADTQVSVASAVPPHVADTKGLVGRVAHVEGPVVEVQFDPARMPLLFDALTLADPFRNLTATAVVAQHLPNGVARCVLLTPAAGLTYGQEATDTGGPDLRPVPNDALRQAVAILGRDRMTEPVLLETGIKAVDLFCPIPRGGKVGIFSEWGLGTTVFLPELLRLLEGRPGGVSLFTLLQLQIDPQRWKENVAEMVNVAGERQTVYLPIGDPNDLALRAQFDMLDVTLPMTRRLARQGLYPPIDPQTSHSKLLDPRYVGREHVETAEAVRQILRRYLEFQPAIERLGMEGLSTADRVWVSHARKLERFLAQPFFIAEPFTGIPGKSVPCAETIRGCRALLEGAYDALPEQAFYMIGRIEESADKHRQS